MFEFVTDSGNSNHGAVIRAIGVGGGGGNAIDFLKDDNVTGVDFIAANSDSQALAKNKAEIKIQIGKNIAKGLGVGGNPEIGKKSAEENIEDIKGHIKGSDMILVSAGMGGGTGTGAAPVIAKAAKELGCLVTAVVTRPFANEGSRRAELAQAGIEELRKNVDAMIIVSNQKLLENVDKTVPFKKANRIVNEVLISATKGILDIIQSTGMMNIDFADIRGALTNSGDALIGIGVAKGENRAVQATENAFKSPLLDGIEIRGAQSILVNITGDENMSTDEIDTIVNMVREAAGGDPDIKRGIAYFEDESIEEIQVTVLATHFAPVEDIKVVEEVEEVVEETPAAKMKDRQQLAGNKYFNKNQRDYLQPIFPQQVAQAKFSDSRSAGVVGIPAQYAQNAFKSAPRGTNELKETDIPAYARRKNINIQPLIQDEEDMQQIPSCFKRTMD